MKKLFVKFALVLAFLPFLTSCTYNSIVEKEEHVEQAWAQVQNVYQRRSDLIPNLVNTVKGVANFEKSTLTAVIEARAKATSIQIDPKNLTPEKLAEFQGAQQGLSGALGRLMVVSEQYPALRANENFTQLMAQLEGTENRITVERMKFNQSVQDYNTYIRKFPNNLQAGMFGFEKKGYFKADAGTQNTPKVEF